jgi:hypothetical protein
VTYASLELSTKEIDRFWSKVLRPSPDACWIWQGRVNSNGYGRFEVWQQGRRFRPLAHRIAYRLDKGGLDDTIKLLHRCDLPSCCNPDHLRPGTQADNMADASAKGRLAGKRVPRGENHYATRLTDSDVRQIRRRYAAGQISQRALAAEYQVSQRTIGAIALRQTWTHVVDICATDRKAAAA